MRHSIYGDIMRRAIACAKQGWGRTHPNPLVGAVICENGEVVAEGFHARAGEPHAEIMALRALGRKPAPGAVMFVTMEPCSTHGRTPPCTQAILEAGLRTLVVGAVDPNPAHAGRGLDLLRGRGVNVVEGVLADECEDLNLVFNYWIQNRAPLIAGKSAVTLDACAATRSGKARWISGPQSRADTHRWRAYFPAIAVGAGTALADNPSLTVRLEGAREDCPHRRFVFDRRLRTLEQPNLNVFTDAFRARTVLVSDVRAPQAARARAAELGVALWTLEGDDFFAAFRARCAQEGVYGVYCEGGPSLLSALLKARALDYLFLYRAPLLFADEQAPAFLRGLAPETPDQGLRLRGLRREVLGDDDLLRGFVDYPPNPAAPLPLSP